MQPRFWSTPLNTRPSLKKSLKSLRDRQRERGKKRDRIQWLEDGVLRMRHHHAPCLFVTMKQMSLSPGTLHTARTRNIDTKCSRDGHKTCMHSTYLSRSLFCRADSKVKNNFNVLSMNQRWGHNAMYTTTHFLKSTMSIVGTLRTLTGMGNSDFVSILYQLCVIVGKQLIES